MNRILDEKGGELKALYNCPVCKRDFKTQGGFKRHLDVHFEKNQRGTMVQLFKIKSTPPKEVVDAMCTDALSEIFKTFAVTLDGGTKKLNQVESFKAGLKIAVEHLDLVRECLEPVQEATLSAKHRLVKTVIPLWCTIASAYFEELKDETAEEQMTEAAKTMMAILGDFHTILHEETTQKNRTAIVKEWQEVFNDSVPSA